MEQWIVLLGIVVALFVLTALLRTVLGLAIRYVLFVAVAVLVYQNRYGTEIREWMTAQVAVEVAIVAGLAFGLTTLCAALFLRGTRLRFLLVPVIGLAATVLLAEAVTPPSW